MTNGKGKDIETKPANVVQMTIKREHKYCGMSHKPK